MNWDLGSYEHTAVKLRPAAERTIELLAPGPGEVVLDLGCGTGNAALLAAARGARVIGVDPFPRLLEVARETAKAAGLDADFVLGDAAHLPVPDGSLDAVVSVFGVIFAPDAPAAAAEIARALRPGGRLVLSAWIPAGALAAQARMRRERLTEVRGDSPGIPLLAWHETEALSALLAPHGFTVAAHDAEIVFLAESPEAYADTELAGHPLWVEARDVLAPAGRWQQVRADLVRLFTEANEDPGGFRLTSRYVVAIATKAP